MKRPPIPTKLRRTLLVEAGHRCAIPTCRILTTEFAHIIPWSEVREHTYENIIVLCPNCHTHFDKGNIDRKSMYMYKDNLRYVIEKYSSVEMDLLVELFRLPTNEHLPFFSANSFFIKRILEEGFVELVPMLQGTTIGRVKVTPDFVVLTKKGRTFMSNFSTKNIGYDT